MSITNIAVHLDPAGLADQLAHDVRAGLLATPKALPPKYFYDARGSELFEEITRLQEYYPTRAESQILTQRAAAIASLTQAQTLVEIGSGTSEKTRLLLRALSASGSLRQFVPFDVDPVVLQAASVAVAAELPGITVSPVVGDFEHPFDQLPQSPRRLMVFLGSTIGNLAPPQRAKFLSNVRRALVPGDAFLLGLDLVKSPARLVAAYDDSRGVTAQFNKNVLAVINRQLGANFDLGAFEHVALWDPAQEWIQMRLRSIRKQSVHVAALGLDVEFAAGEEMRTEISAKFRRDTVTKELATAGLHLRQWWTDPAGDFALTLCEPS